MLSEGGTIERKNVRSKTLKAYLKAAADIIVEAGYPDPRFSDTHLAHNTEKYLPRIRVILDEQRRWETMEDKKDPVTPEMILWLRHQAQLAAFTSILAATADWAALGLSAGFRICEYGQRSKSVFKEFMQLRDGSSAKLPRAFIFSDFRFLDERSCPLHPSQRHRAAYLTITWRKQKNADNGKEVTFHRAADQRLCPVRAGASIYTRALHLNHRDKILGVSDAGPLRDKQVEKHLQSAARAVYGYSKSEAKQRFTSHSIRVGACVLLHEAGKTAAFIKERLRWKSDSFMEYLRNTVRLAQQHAASLFGF